MAENPYRLAFEAAMEEVDEVNAQLAEKKKFANMLATKAGLPVPFEDADAGAVTSGLALKADQFTSIGAPSVAARAYLEMRGKDKGADNFERIYAALVKGGFVFGKGDSKAGLKIAMGKDEKLIKLPNDAYGLREWYGGAKKLDRAKKGSAGESADDEGEEEIAESPTPSATAPNVSEKEGTPT